MQLCSALRLCDKGAGCLTSAANAPMYLALWAAIPLQACNALKQLYLTIDRIQLVTILLA